MTNPKYNVELRNNAILYINEINGTNLRCYVGLVNLDHDYEKSYLVILVKEPSGFPQEPSKHEILSVLNDHSIEACPNVLDAMIEMGTVFEDVHVVSSETLEEDDHPVIQNDTMFFYKSVYLTAKVICQTGQLVYMTAENQTWKPLKFVSQFLVREE